MAKALLASSVVLARLTSRCNAFVAGGIGETFAVWFGCCHSSSTACVCMCTASARRLPQVLYHRSLVAGLVVIFPTVLLLP